MNKQCRKCKQSKTYQEFDKKVGCIGGVVSTCKVCRKARQTARKEEINAKRRETYAKSPQKVLARNAKDAKRNKKKISEYLALYSKENREELKAYHRSWSAAWRKENRAEVNAKATQYRAAKFKATPLWLTQTHKDQIELFYDASTRLIAELGVRFEVDHIIPLQGKDVCGLHVPWNLQVIPMVENRSKNNRLKCSQE